MLQRLVALPLALRIDPFRYHAACLPRERQQHCLVNRRRNRTRTRYSRKLRGHFFLVFGSDGIKNYEEMAAKLSAIPGTRSVTPAVYQTVLLSFAGQARGVVTKGIDPERKRKSDEALQHVVAGRLDF